MDVCFTKWELFEFAFRYAEELKVKVGLGAVLVFEQGNMFFQYIPIADAYCTSGLPV